ncbi:unnamed protein product [Fraxinus pennsylvanica]|uniref:Uncharacterized protein n=1 Tax=Fraxinus pennsylvanica TaxID=56036 RepID=A0AAD1Z4B2_9LAMI|nr:unnamed protein product [Fraxinus pennsylvanica]
MFHTKRFSFAPPKGLAVAEKDSSRSLLTTLEGSRPRSLCQHLACLDLCVVSESNVDTWRRAALLELTGRTYRKVIAVCLRLLEQFTINLSRGLQNTSMDNNPSQLSDPLCSLAKQFEELEIYESFYDSQVRVNNSMIQSTSFGNDKLCI